VEALVNSVSNWGDVDWNGLAQDKDRWKLL
jgi:hypothetical protein